MTSAEEWWQDFFDEDMKKILFPEERWQKAEENADALVRLLEILPGANILDLACGTGRYAIPLARRGFQVTALDLTPAYLQEGQKKAEAENLSIRWVQGDMRDIPFQDAFDAVINIFTSFGFFEEESDHWKTLKGIAKALKPGGKFLMDVIHRDWLIRNFRPRNWHQQDGDSYLLEESQFDEVNSRVISIWTLLLPSRRREYRFSLRAFTLKELIQLCASAGLEYVKACGSLSGEALSLDSQRLIFLARKPLP